MDIRRAYNSWSDSYDTDRNLTRDLDAQVTRDVLGKLRPRSVLELGCGTGKNTEFLAQLGERVQALDFSEGMLAQARQKVTAENVTFTVADLTQSWRCEDGFVDLVVCNLVLEHISDVQHIFREARRCLRAQGHMFVCELHPAKQYKGSKAGFQQGSERVEVAAYVHHISEFLDSAAGAGLTLISLKEWWHPEDKERQDDGIVPPRLVSFLFGRP